MSGGLHKNRKTVLSVDFSTICPRKRAGRACAYCYVEAGRRNGGYMAKRVIEYEGYNGFVKRLRKETIRKLNKIGGLRLFSFADYFPRKDADLKPMLADCLEVGLKVKAITKVLAFVRKYHDHPAINVINISIDTLGRVRGSTITHECARRYREKYDKVAVRAAVMSYSDLEYFSGLDWVDIYTLNHAMNGFTLFSRAERDALAVKYSGKLCCVGGECVGCKIKCGRTG